MGDRRSRVAFHRVAGYSTQRLLVAVALAVVLSLGAWTLLADDGPAAGTQAATGAAEPVPPAPAAPFRYSDLSDPVLFRVDSANPVVPTADRPAGDDDTPILISRQSALAAARRGTLDIELPDGTRYPVSYERSESAPGGNWTFIGRVDTTVGDLAAVLTFGRDGVFGLLPTPDGTMMEITTRAGRAFLRPAGGIVPPGVDPTRHPDFLPPSERTPRAVPGAPAAPPESTPGARASRAAMASATATIGQAAADGEVTIDILATYTTNLVALRGSKNAAETEFHNLVAITNQAHIDSGSRVRIAIAGFAEVDYPATTDNRTMLYAITDGDLPDGTDIRALRDAAAADLVAVIRPHADGDPTCGIAWLPGESLMAYELDAANGYSVTAVEDCGPLVLAHEIGHNLGLMHDRDTVMQQTGGALQYSAFPFSFGYRQDGPPAFATVMAYDEGNQVWVNRFSHPGTSLCEGTACGIAHESDNVRSLNLTGDTIARFRDPLDTLSILDARVLESDEGTRRLRFTIRASSPAPVGGVTFDLSITGGTATSGVDWVPAPDWLPEPTEIVAGSDTADFYLDVLPDTLEEGDETILVRLQNVQGMAVHDAEAVGVIQDDDPRISVRGRLLFPGGVPTPALADIGLAAQTTGLGLFDGGAQEIEVQGANHLYEALVPKGGSLELYASLPDPFFIVTEPQVGIIEPLVGAHLPVQVGVRLSGELKFRGCADWCGQAPLILWNPRGNGFGYYANYYSDGDFWGGYADSYDSLVMRHVPMQLEVPDPPAPYVRQLVEVPPMSTHATVDIELRKVPSLTIAHATVTEATSANNFNLVTMTAELSLPAPPGGVSFAITTDGTAGADDFLMPATSFAIAEGATTVPVTVVVYGDDRGEPDETIELHVADIEGAAWSPGPGTLRIVTDEPREADDGTCTGSTEWPSVRMCQ